MSKLAERDEFIAVMTSEFWPHLAKDRILAIAQQLLRCGATSRRLSEARCCRELSAAEERRDQANDKRIAELCGRLPSVMGKATSAEIGGDPRGYTVKLRLPSGRSNHWGGESWGVPTS